MKKVILLLLLGISTLAHSQSDSTSQANSAAAIEAKVDLIYDKFVKEVKAEPLMLSYEADLWGEPCMKFFQEELFTNRVDSIKNKIRLNLDNISIESLVSTEAKALKTSYLNHIKLLYQALDKEKCKEVKTGKFYYSIGDEQIVLMRVGDKQIEKTKLRNLEFSVKWINDCEYELVQLNYQQGDALKDATLIVKIYDVQEETYSCLSLVSTTGMLVDGVISRVVLKN